MNKKIKKDIKRFKQLICLTLSIIMVMGMSITSFAAETELNTEQYDYSVTVNEYDIYVETRNASPQALSISSVSDETAEIIKSNAIENWLTELSDLSADELSTMSYDINQISLIQSYSGERIETNPALRGLFADLTASFSKVSASTSSLSVKVTWTWSNAPVLSGFGIEDMPAIRWQGTNSAGQPINLSLNTSGSSCSFDYYSRYTGQSEVYQYSKTATIKTDDPYGHAYAYVPMGANSGANPDYYAKKGTITIKVDRTGTNTIKEAAFVFGYGHPIITSSPSLSLPVSFGIGFSTGVEKMCEVAIRMSNTGVITTY